jgi:hypothetical protein
MLCGGVQATGATAEDTALINSLNAAINAKVGHQHDSYEIVSVSSQIVAGTNKFYHLRAQPGNHEYTITVYIALPHTGLAPEVSEVSSGFNAHKNGHSDQHGTN